LVIDYWLFRYEVVVSSIYQTRSRVS